MTQAVSTPEKVHLDDLQVGDLLAEGGEGKVYQLPLQPHLVLKSYRRPAPRSPLEELVSWPEVLDPGRADVVASASAWPKAVVVDEAGAAVGLLLPRAPRRFAVRHRDGNSRLASLSYLTADPGHRRAAYGLDLPAPASAERIGLAYALARLLTVFEQATPAVAHGDLSTKNILWSLQRGPEVFVIDCDNSEWATGGQFSRRRAMTPNWNDPAVGPGENPTPASDRYSMALVFLRVVGAANFPIQARQRQGGVVHVEVAIPNGSPVASFPGGDSEIWNLCARGLSITAPDRRPRAEEWAEVIESLLEAAGEGAVAEAVRVAQGGWEPAVAGPSGDARPTGAARPATDARSTDVRSSAVRSSDVRIIPVAAPRRAERHWTRVTPGSLGMANGTAPAAGGLSRHPIAAAAAGRPEPTGSRPEESIWPELASGLVAALRWYVRLHRQTARELTTGGQRADGAKSLAMCAVVDVVVAVIGGFMVAMAVAPLLGL